MSECEACGFVPESVRSDPRILAHHALLASRDAEIARLRAELGKLLEMNDESALPGCVCQSCQDSIAEARLALEEKEASP